MTLTIDHIKPRASGGKDTWTNLTSACLPCNNKKGNRTPEEASMPLIKTPYKPNHITFILKSANRIDEVWKSYLFQT